MIKTSPTGRVSGSPNAQNIPIRTEEGRKLRMALVNRRTKMFEAKEDCCQEVSFVNPMFPCNLPATKVITWKTEGPYRMCDMCADHSVKNRGATLVGGYTPKEHKKWLK